MVIFCWKCNFVIAKLRRVSYEPTRKCKTLPDTKEDEHDDDVFPDKYNYPY